MVLDLERRRAEPDRVRRYTSREQLRRIDEAMEDRIDWYRSQPPDVIDARIEELRREWSIERYLQINVAAVGLTGLALAVALDRKWGLLTCGALGFFLFHAIEGFDPPLPLLRRQGVRTRAEIDQEIYALKIIRGDFALIEPAVAGDRRELHAAFSAVGL